MDGDKEVEGKYRARKFKFQSDLKEVELLCEESDGIKYPILKTPQGQDKGEEIIWTVPNALTNKSVAEHALTAIQFTANVVTIASSIASHLK